MFDHTTIGFNLGYVLQEVVRANMKVFRDDLVRCQNIGINYYPTEQTIKELEEDLQAMDSITQ